jgi:Leucine-rich repeat (LRR) protein
MHTRRHCAGFKSVPDCFLPPPHRNLVLSNNQLSVLLAGIFSGLISLDGLYLSGNELTALPHDLFSGLISLR